MFNVDLARRVTSHIREHPEQHRQEVYVRAKPERTGYALAAGPLVAEPDVLAVARKAADEQYRCNTTACVAGWAVVLSGEEAVRRAWETIPEQDREEAGEVWFETGRRLLGLDADEAYDIFLIMDEEEALARLTAMIEEAGGGETDAVR